MRSFALGFIISVGAGAVGLAIAFALGGGISSLGAPSSTAASRDTYAIAGLARLSEDPPLPQFLLEPAAPVRRVVRHRRPRPHHHRAAPVIRAVVTPRVVVAVPAPRPAPAPTPAPVPPPAPVRVVPRPVAQPPVVIDDSG